LADVAWTWTLLERPFSAVALGTALGLPGVDAAIAPGPKAEKSDRYPPVEIRTARPVPPTLGGPATDQGPAGVKAAAKRSPAWAPFAAAGGAQAGLVEWVSRVVAALTQSWQAKRRVRVVGFSAFALVAFTVAFALAAQGGRCGPGCDAFGTVFSPEPTVAPASSSRVASTTGPKRSTTTTATPSGLAGAGAFRGVSGSGGQLAVTTTMTERQVTETTLPATTWPATTKPPATTLPPATEPPTTAPPTTEPPTTAPPTTAPKTTVGA
jgi:hypothetical protein